MQCPETQEALHVRDDISISHGSIPKEHRGTGRILEVLAVDEKPSLLSAVLHHVDELRRVVHGHVVLDGLLDHTSTAPVSSAMHMNMKLLVKGFC